MLYGLQMDDPDFQERMRKMYEDHARFMALVEAAPPPTEDQKRAIQEMLDSQKRAYDDHLKKRAETEAKEQQAWEDGAAARQAELEKSPAHWKRLYLGMVEREEERKRSFEMTQSIVIVTALAGVVLLALKYFFHW